MLPAPSCHPEEKGGTLTKVSQVLLEVGAPGVCLKSRSPSKMIRVILAQHPLCLVATLAL